MTDFQDRVRWDICRWADRVKTGLVNNNNNGDDREMTMDRNLDKYHIQEVLGFEDSPAIVVDQHGRILLWFLPGILSDQAQARVEMEFPFPFHSDSHSTEQKEANESTKSLAPLLRKTFLQGLAKEKEALQNGKRSSWRRSAFRQPAHSAEFQTGVLDISPSVFPAAHQVCLH